MFLETFPGCTVAEWTPIERTKTRVEEAWGMLVAHFTATSEPIWFRTVYQAIGMDRQNFRKTIRLNKTFLKLCEGKIQEVLVGKKGSYDAFGLIGPWNPFRRESTFDWGPD